jgi:hypothetical protein
MPLKDALNLALALGVRVEKKDALDRYQLIYREHVAWTPASKRECAPPALAVIRTALRDWRNNNRGEYEVEVTSDTALPRLVPCIEKQRAKRSVTAEVAASIESAPFKADGEQIVFDSNGTVAPTPTLAPATTVTAGMNLYNAQARWENITPDYAEHCISQLSSANRRALNMKHVMRIADSIEREHWVPNGEAIIFDSNGMLIDGQHRMAAIALAGRTVTALVVRGVAPSAAESIDLLSKPRNIFDVMRWRGTIMDKRLIALAKGMLSFLEGKGGATVMTVGRDARNINEVIAFVERYIEMFRFLEPRTEITCSRMSVGARSMLLAPAIQLMVSHYDASEYSMLSGLHKRCPPDARERVVEFLDGVATGSGLKIGNPMLTLRNWALTRHNTSQPASTRDSELTACVRAWNAYVEGRSIMRIIATDFFDGKPFGVSLVGGARVGAPR